MLIIINIINNKDLWVCDRKNENERTKNSFIKKHPSPSCTQVFPLFY